MNRRLLNKVPEVTIFFWIIKVLCTTVGESAADFLNYNLNWGLTATSVVTGLVFFGLLATQMSLTRYIATVYWLTVVLVSVFGTLVTDNLTDNLGVPLETSTIVFSLGTAAGDLISEGLGVGYKGTALLCACLIGIITIAWRLGLDAVLAFWLAYILTRPLGASIGDWLAQPVSNGGLGLGVTVTSVIFLTAIALTIVYLTIRKPDVITVPTDPVALAELDKPETAPHHRTESPRTALIQTVVVLVLVVVVGGGFYVWRTNVLNAEAADVTASSSQSGSASGTTSPLGDMTAFVTITKDTLNLLNAGKQSDATTRITDLESAWDNAEATLKRRNESAWHGVDDKIDTVLRELRSTSPNPPTEKSALQALLTQMGT